MAWIDPDELRAYVEASCLAQGVPVKVCDPETLARLVVLLGGVAPVGPEPPRRSGRPAPHPAKAANERRSGTGPGGGGRAA